MEKEKACHKTREGSSKNLEGILKKHYGKFVDNYVKSQCKPDDYFVDNLGKVNKSSLIIVD